jgi:hypothetical protein
VRAAAAAVLIVLVTTGCGHRPHEFAGMGRDDARRDSIYVARTMPNVEALTNDFASELRAKPLRTYRDRNSVGGEAWLTVFRLFKNQQGDPDQGCVWAWRDAAGPHYEDAPSVAWGHVPNALHDRCADFVFAHHLASPDETAGDEQAPPTIARPQPVTPLGPLAPGTYAVDVLANDAFFLAGPSVAAPVDAPAGACGYAGIVENAAATKLVPYATVAILPSHAWSGISDGGPLRWPRDALTVAADHWGAFVITNLPYREAGYDISIRALGYGPAKLVHEPCYEGDLAVGEWPLQKVPTFADATPYPVAPG